MIRKAEENLEAAMLLLEKGLCNASASRAYYAAYHACWWALEQVPGMVPDKERCGSKYWSHDGIARQACIHVPQGFSAELRDDFNDMLLSERIVADYDEEDCDAGAVELCIQVAREMLSTLREAFDE